MKHKESVRVEEVMSRGVATCLEGSSLSEAAGIMWNRDCGIVPVVDPKRRLVGVITDRDVCMAAYTKGLPLDAIRVADVMSRDVKACRAEDEVESAEATMRSRRVRRVPVIDAEGRAVGIVSLNDLARHAALQRDPARQGLGYDEVGETLASIGQPWSKECDQPVAVGTVVPASRPTPARAR